VGGTYPEATRTHLLEVGLKVGPVVVTAAELKEALKRALVKVTRTMRWENESTHTRIRLVEAYYGLSCLPTDACTLVLHLDIRTWKLITTLPTHIVPVGPLAEKTEGWLVNYGSL